MNLGTTLCRLGLHKWDFTSDWRVGDVHTTCSTFARCCRPTCPRYTKPMLVNIDVVDREPARR